jgi:hypothetical protein
MNSATEWVASIPAQITAHDAVKFIDAALADEQQATDEIVNRFHGTVPPPPWPRHAELVKARDAFEGGRKMLVNFIIPAGHGDTPRDHTDPQVVRLLNAGRSLYREIGVMQERMRGIKAEELPGLVLDAALDATKRAAATQLGGLFVVAGLLWALNEFGDD